MADSVKPRLARGTRDFLPSDMELRNWIIDKIKEQFELFRFVQIETPAVENLETLTGKYGDEGDQLIFKILNSGDFLSDTSDGDLQSRDLKKLLPKISEKALRYDLTVPFARFVAQHRNDINFPFKRYQIQPVWRADRPAKGRYREFYQCDADVIGSNSLLVEAEFISMINRVFKALGIEVDIRLNNRKILYGFCQNLGIQDQFMEFTVVLDKLDKKSWNALINDFKDLGLNDAQIESVKKFIDLSGNQLDETVLGKVETALGSSEEGPKGVKELRDVRNFLSENELQNVLVDLSLARGLNYYTGAIIEVGARNEDMGSICGGGRYDDLTGVFGLQDVSGMGISFGIDRIYDILKDKEHASGKNDLKILFANFGEDEAIYSLQAVNELRTVGIPADIYPDVAKMKKQFKYADQEQIDFMVIAGEEEMNKKVFQVKNLKEGTQKEMSLEEMKTVFRQDA